MPQQRDASRDSGHSVKGLSALVLNPLASHTLVDDCYHELKRAILELDLAPGEPLSEIRIAASLGTSKTPVRQAFARLTSEHLIVPLPGRHSCVAALPPEFLHEIYQVRLMLEPPSLRTVAPTLTDENFATLDRLMTEFQDAHDQHDRKRFSTAGLEFHRYLIACSNNTHMINIVAELFDHVIRIHNALFLSEEVADHGWSRKGVEDHRRIVDALLNDDGERAAELIAADIGAILEPSMERFVEDALARLTSQHR